MTLVRSNSQMFSSTQYELAQKVVQHVVFGELTKAQSMLKNDPALSLITCTVFDYSGREINANAIRAAMGAKNPAMITMLIEVIKQHYPDTFKSILAENFEAQFPDGVKKPTFYPQGQVVQGEDNYDFHGIVKAIKQASDEEIEAFLQHPDDESFISPLTEPFIKFRQYFSPQKILTGFHCNMQNLRNAFNIYNHLGDDPGLELKTTLQHTLFYRMVIGYIERMNPAHYAQAFCQGLSSLLDDDEAPKESMLFSYENDNNLSYFPLDQDPSQRFGYHVASNHMGTPPVSEFTLYSESDGGTSWMLRLEVFDILNSQELWEMGVVLGLSEERGAQLGMSKSNLN